MSFQIIRNDITRVTADAIVNTANPHPTIGAGTDSAIYKAAGERALLRARKKIGEMVPGQAEATPAFNLDARYIIHTVGPVWTDGTRGEQETLSQCYFNCLKKAEELGCESIAFPLLATGSYGFPKDQALQIAISVFSSFLMTHDMEITLVVFGQKAFDLSDRLFPGIDAYIDEHYVAEKRREEYGDKAPRRYENRIRTELIAPPKPSAVSSFRRQDRADKALEDMAPAFYAAPDSVMPLAASRPGTGMELDDLIASPGETFQQRLLHLIDERHLTDVEVYKKANLDRKLFSKIRCNTAYRPKKKTAVALAIALELNLEETKDLLERAEMALSPSSRFDLIITWFILHQNYNIYDINVALFDRGEDTLGC